MKESEDFLALGGESFRSRLFVGTGKFSSGDALQAAVESSGSEMVTVAMKRRTRRMRRTRYWLSRNGQSEAFAEYFWCS